MIKKINGSGKSIVTCVLLTLALMGLLNHMTPMLVDDYRYCFSFVKGRARMTSVGQLIPSMLAHYQSMNGRLITHGIVQLVLMKVPAAGFDLMNSAMFTLLCFLLYDVTWGMKNRKQNVCFYLIGAAAVWAFVPAFGQVFLWLDGSCNYLWPTTLLLLYLRPVIKGTLRERSIGYRIVYTVLGVIMGGLSETVSMAAMGWLFLRFLYDRFALKKNLWSGYLLPLLTMAPSYLFMILSPGTRKNKLGGNAGFAGRFNEVFTLVTREMTVLIVVWVLLAVCVVHMKKNEELWHKSCIFAFLSCGMSFMHCFTGTYPHRGMIGSAVFWIIADGLLLCVLWESERESVYHLAALLLGAGTLLYAVFQFVPGVYDIGKTYQAMRSNELTLEQAALDGEKRVTLPLVTPVTRYSSVYDLKYLDTEKAKSWPNNSIAQYYGLKAVKGTE